MAVVLQTPTLPTETRTKPCSCGGLLIPLNKDVNGFRYTCIQCGKWHLAERVEYEAPLRKEIVR